MSRIRLCAILLRPSYSNQNNARRRIRFPLGCPRRGSAAVLLFHRMAASRDTARSSGFEPVVRRRYLRHRGDVRYRVFREAP